jgi:hypothetical protein
MLVNIRNIRGIREHIFNKVFSFYRAEWGQAYKQIYSDDTVAQVKGLERLLVWKARCVLLYVTYELFFMMCL